MQRLWADTHFPAGESQLVVSKKKVAEVKEFLTAPGGRRLLLLKGPAGCGKASVLRALCADLGFELVEWSPASGKSADGDESRADAFLRFMAQTDRYSRLNGGGAAPSGRPRVSLVRDFPFTLVEKTPGDASKSSSSFLDRLAAMINAGSVQRAVLSFNDSRDDHRIITRLLQPVVYSAVAQVVFDGLPRTFAQKALDSLTTAQGLPSGAANTAALAAESGGDLRQAINALQLWTGSQRCAPTTSVNTRARNRGSTEKRTKAQLLAEAPRDAEASLRMANLGLFHALGRLLWCKRIPPGGDEVEMSAGGTKRRRKATTSGDPEPKQLPHHLLVPKASRPSLYFVPEEVIAQSQTEPQMLVQWLFTNAPRFYGSVTDLAAFTGALAEADAWSGISSGSWRGWKEDVDTPVAEELATSVQVRSLLDANLHPVPPAFRSATSSPDADVAAASAFNMVRPSTWDVQRHRIRRLEELTAHLVKLGPEALGGSAVRPSLVRSTLPFVHLLLQSSRGQHPKLNRLPHPMMQLLMGMSSGVDGEFVFHGTVDAQSSQGAGFKRPSQPVESTATPDSWKFALPDDPIEDV